MLLGRQVASFIAAQRGRLSTTTFLRLKQISEVTDGTTVTVEGKYVESDKSNRLLQVNDPHVACPLCRLNMKISFKDVLVLGQFMRADGTVLPRHMSGLCVKQQHRVEKLVQQAHWAGLFPNHKPKSYNASVERSGYKEFNRYFEDPSDLYKLKIKQKPGSFYFVRRYE